MEQPLLLQARQFLLSAALGAALGLHYDLLRGLRRWARWLTHPLDLWFALSVLAANLWFALRIGGGQFRIFALVLQVSAARLQKDHRDRLPQSPDAGLNVPAPFPKNGNRFLSQG